MSRKGRHLHLVFLVVMPRFTHSFPGGEVGNQRGLAYWNEGGRFRLIFNQLINEFLFHSARRLSA